MARREGGMVSAETALAITALLLVLAVCLAGIRLGLDQVRAHAAAGVAVRGLVRGDDPERVRATALASAPEGASVDWSVAGAVVTARVVARPRALGLLGPSRTVRAEASGRLEAAAP